MNPRTVVSTTLLTALFALSVPAFAQHSHSGEKKPAAPAKGADDYPLNTCVVSDEALGSMGDSFNYVHKEAGKPDRLVRFCCEGCVDDFKKEPAKYLAKIDAAAKAKSSGKGGTNAKQK